MSEKGVDIFRVDEEAEVDEGSIHHEEVMEIDEHNSVHEDCKKAVNDGGSFVSSSSFSIRWPQSYREATDSYTIAASPKHGILLRTQSILSPCLSHNDSEVKFPLLAGQNEANQEERMDALLTKQPPSITEESGLQLHAYGEDSTIETHGCSVSQTVFNGVNAFVGMGILSVPSTVQEGGWVSIGLLVLFAIICYYTGTLLRKCLESNKDIIIYPDIGQAAFGHYGRLLLSIVFYVELYFCLVEFIILEADNLAKLFPSASFNLGSLYLSPEHALGITAALVVLPSCYLKDFRVISFLSVGGVLGAILTVISLVLVGVLNNIGFNQTGPLVKWSGVPYALGVFGFCFSGHSLLPNLYHSMSNKKEFSKALSICFVLSTSVYVAVAIFGFLMFGENTESQITLNLPQNSIASQIALWITVISPLTKYALLLNPLARSLEEMLPLRLSNSYCCSILLRTSLVVSTVCVAFLVPFFGLLMALAGSLLCMLASLIMPSLCFLRIASKPTPLQIVICYIVAGVGVLVAILGTYSSLYDIIQSY